MSERLRRAVADHFMKTEKISSAVPWALMLDAAVIITNFLLVGYLSRQMRDVVWRAWTEDDAQAGRLLGSALLVTFVAQMVGALLKGGPMHARLAAKRANENAQARGNKRKKIWARGGAKDAPRRYARLFGVLIFLHFILSTLIVFSIPVLLGLSFNLWMILFIIPFMFIPTILVWGALEPPKQVAPPSGLTAHPLTEVVANVCLFSYALINQLFWGGLLVSNSPLQGTGEIPMRALQSFLFLIPVTMMYFFAPRILFLAEELDDRRTRLSMKLALGSVAFRWIIGG